MAQFLGEQYCIESLRKDLDDIQATILEVFSRTGPVQKPSWKFPDKSSCDLDMLALLRQFDYVEGEATINQYSHFVLLELVIDRLLLLLQSFNIYVEQLRCNHRQRQTRKKGCVSIGLVVRTYWNCLLQFTNKKEISIGEQKKVKMFIDDENHQLTSEATDFPRHPLSAWSSTSSLKTKGKSLGVSTSGNNTPCYPNLGIRSVGCQTVEFSLAPCNACCQVQTVLSKTGNALVNLFQSECLPSSLQPFLEVVKDTLELGQMTAVDVVQWANEQLRDICLLEKHLQDVRGTVQPLKERVITVETELEKSRLHLAQSKKEFRQEIEKHQTSNVQLEFSLRKGERALLETKQKLKEEQQRLRRETLFLEEMSLTLKEKVTSQQNYLHALENERNVLKEKVSTLEVKEEFIRQLQERVQQLQIQIFECQHLLDKECAKYISACRQQESMQVKQNSLLKRVDALDEECEELHRRLENQEEREVNLNRQLQEFCEEKERLQVHLNQEKATCLEKQKDKQTLETDLCELRNTVGELKEHVNVLKERERLLVAFPELTPLPQSQSTGDVLLDMQQQLKANNIRIKILEQQNASIQQTLAKVGERTYYNLKCNNRNGVIRKPHLAEK